jgi:methionyl-tRNA synthetase
MFLTTAIDYVNAKPHIGHAFEKVLVDTIARFHRLQGHDVWFLTGTDENATKNVQAARAAGLPVQSFIDQNAQAFLDLSKALNLSHDRFIRTTESAHHSTCKRFFQKLADQGHIYQGQYQGLYCPGCEAYVTEKDLVNGCCPEHNSPPIPTREECYFFQLQSFLPSIRHFVENRVTPDSRANEILARLDEPLHDLPVSRKNLGWGIPTPVDPNHTIYVWFDALLNYYTGSNGHWPATHVIGKGINWFHSVVWPAILLAADCPLPQQIVVHGYLNVGGKKISKSLGNTIDPRELLAKHGTDAVRFSLLRCSTFNDADFSESLLIERFNTDLANKFGNLVSRVAALVAKYGTQPTSLLVAPSIEPYFAAFEIDKALAVIFEFVDVCNELVDQTKPWETKDQKALYQLLNAVKSLTTLLWPFIPQSCEQIAKRLGFTINWANVHGNPITRADRIEPVFRRI